MTESPRPERRRLGGAPRSSGTPERALEPPKKPGKRPFSPLVVFFLTWFGTIFVAMMLVQVVGNPSIAAMTKASEGGATFGFFLGLIAAVRARSRVRNWETQQNIYQTREMVANRTAGMKCKTCDERILSTTQPWQKESYCSEKCRQAQAGG
jgi:hypothetical protein